VFSTFGLAAKTPRRQDAKGNPRKSGRDAGYFRWSVTPNTGETPVPRFAHVVFLGVLAANPEFAKRH
jgi:hypothetical protein